MFLHSKTFLQVLVAILSGALWVPYLGSFPITLLLATVATFVLSLSITKMGPVRCIFAFYSPIVHGTCFRYFFGLPTTKRSCLPGKLCQGFLPCIILGISALSIWLSVYLFLTFHYCKSYPTAIPCYVLGIQWPWNRSHVNRIVNLYVPDGWWPGKIS